MGQGNGEVGDSLGEDGEEQPGAGQAGDRPGDHLLDVEISLQELAEIMGEELELPRIMPKGTEKIVATLPLQRLGKTDEVARAIHFLCTDASSYVTGAELHINGGQHV